jgi:hypothetical protein
MEFDNKGLLDDGESHPKNEKSKPNAWRVDNEDNLAEDNLKRSLTGEPDRNRVMEGKPMGGQNFGKNNVTPAGDDKNNPSQNAGYNNPYFARTQPSEEHPEDNNFKSPGQQGRPDYTMAQSDTTIANEMPKPEKIERGNGENDRPHKGAQYQEGTVDNENKPDNPGGQNGSEQEEVGESDDDIAASDET